MFSFVRHFFRPTLHHELFFYATQKESNVTHTKQNTFTHARNQSKPHYTIPGFSCEGFAISRTDFSSSLILSFFPPAPSPLPTTLRRARSKQTKRAVLSTSICNNSQDGWLRQDDEFSDDEKDRFDIADPTCADRPAAGAAVAAPRSDNPYAAAIGVGVRIGAGAAAGGAGAMAGGGGHRVFVSALMFRRGAVSEEEARADPALRALSAYRAVAWGYDEGLGGVGTTGNGDVPGGGGAARFPISAVEALVEKPR